MTTIADLHLKAGNPDFSHWRTKKIYTLIEAALLTCGIEPLNYDGLADFKIKDYLKNDKPVNWQHAYMMIDALVEALCTQEIKSPYIVAEYPYSEPRVIEQIDVGFDDVNFIVRIETRITRAELHRWLDKQGYLEPPKLLKKDFVRATNFIDKPKPRLITNTYTTPALECVEAVIKEFWHSYDPQGNQPPPKQTTVKSWIEANYPDIKSDVLREYIDKICRHPTAKSGGNKPRNIKDITPTKN